MSAVSVIIPLYNKALYLEKSLQSVKDQTFTDWECIIVDDGSTDGSGTLTEQLTASDSRFRVLRQPNSGVSTARNNGIAASHGEYVCFLDADDWWAPTFLEEMVWLIGQYPDAGIYGSDYWYVKTGKTHVAVNAPTGYINYPCLYKETGAMPLTSISVMMRRTICDEMGGFLQGIKLGEDFLLWSKIAVQYKVAFLGKPLAYYNNDIPASHRATRNLHAPQYHMLFNMQWQEKMIDTFPDVAKRADWQALLDWLRVRGLKEYWMDSKYQSVARFELAKVDWHRQPFSERLYYHTPLFLLRAHACFMRLGSFCKQKLLKLLNK